MKNSIGLEQLGDAINRELTLYGNNIIERIKKETKNSMTQLVKQTKATAPVGKRTRHYRDSIKSKKVSENDRSITYMWYVDGSDYRLSHLLENGHALRDGGRYEGTQFIAKAHDPIIAKYIEAVEDAIKNG